MTEVSGVSTQDRKRALRFIVCMGAVSLFADATYEGAYSIFGPYLEELGAEAWQVGIIGIFFCLRRPLATEIARAA